VLGSSCEYRELPQAANQRLAIARHLDNGKLPRCENMNSGLSKLSLPHVPVGSTATMPSADGFGFGSRLSAERTPPSLMFIR